MKRARKDRDQSQYWINKVLEAEEKDPNRYVKELFLIFSEYLKFKIICILYFLNIIVCYLIYFSQITVYIFYCPLKIKKCTIVLIFFY